MAHLVQLLLPLYGRSGARVDPTAFAKVREELVERFGGLTAYTRSPARGLWQEESSVVRDEIIIYEVMVPTLDRAWWQDYRRSLEARFDQEELVVRASEIEQM